MPETLLLQLEHSVEDLLRLAPLGRPRPNLSRRQLLPGHERESAGDGERQCHNGRTGKLHMEKRRSTP